MANDGPGEWYASLPPVSKFWFASCALSTIGFHLNFVDPRSMALSWTRVREEWQVWRVVTNFVFIGKFSLGFAMRLVMIAQYAVSLERQTFTGTTAGRRISSRFTLRGRRVDAVRVRRAVGGAGVLRG